ncbi:Rid family detoxifying hydrolase [Vibrio sp. SA48]|uniref:Rid family detoxifying hydrolase n=1 Tax=Vibrio sp. S12_S33 TaxID=2720223 RepID=UPI00192D36BC|nr:Rid family detoxifying hydrolase [Vibrio sp. S12_S33]MBD1567276.1 reactive intermediate/imine deaminase [Vibrio sp. S12_S33]
MKLINSEKAPSAIGPYSHGAIINNTLYVSGQLPIDPNTMKFISEDITEQAKQCIENAKAIIEKAGATLNDVARVGIFITNMADFVEINEVYSHYFSNHKPARACVEVSKLPLSAQVEMEFTVDVSK